MFKIALIGPGALGCLLAASFFEAGEEVVLVDYRPERIRRLREQGIQVRTLDGREKLAPVPIAPPLEAGLRTLVVVTVKAHQTRNAAQSLPALAAPDGLVLTLQNGLGNLEEMAAAVGPERLLAGVAFLGVTRRGEGQVVHAGAGPIFIGAPPGSRAPQAEVEQVAALFRRAGWDCRTHPDIETLLWEKLLVNVGINPLTALLRVPNGALLELPEAWELAVAAAREAQAVALATGIPLDIDLAERLRQVCLATGGNRSSMLQDVLAGRPTEIEALNAQVVARGAALGVATPVNHVLTQLLRAWGGAGDRRVG
jgi:2-dehydropantoate 2-reductase